MQNRIVNSSGILLTIMILVGLPFAYADHLKSNHRNVRTVKPGVLYRSGQLSQPGLKRLIDEHGIRTVVSLRNSYVEGQPAPDAAEADFCRQFDVKHIRITPRSWWPQYDGPAPAQKGIASFLQVMDEPTNHPVLLHCFAGTHRTGAMVAIYRMEYERWTNSEAIEELRGAGYKNLDNENDVLTFLENYRARWVR